MIFEVGGVGGRGFGEVEREKVGVSLWEVKRGWGRHSMLGKEREKPREDGKCTGYESYREVGTHTEREIAWK